MCPVSLQRDLCGKYDTAGLQGPVILHNVKDALISFMTIM